MMSNGEDKIISIFSPRSLLKTKSGWLFGYWICAPNPVIYILAVLHGPDPFDKNVAQKCGGRSQFIPSVMGELHNQDVDRQEKTSDLTASNLLREISTLYLRLRIRNCRLMVDKVALHKDDVILTKNCTIYLYDPNCFLTSKLLKVKNNLMARRYSFVEDDFLKFNCLEKLLVILHQWQKFRFDQESEITNAVAIKHGSFNYHPENASNIKKQETTLSKLIFCSSFIRQCSQRIHQVRYVFSPSPFNSHFASCLRCQNTVTSIIIDLLIGLIVLRHLLNWLNIDDLFELFITSAESVVDSLQSLIRWLMGIPAGMKLNSPLSSALGHFFLYHIYLWKTYIIVAKPILRVMTRSIPWIGWFGITFQLSLLSDLVSLATFHIYCFYVYAARLYHLHVCSLISLWRLVRGRKHNPLRVRVDSCSYNVDQLFVGTLLFMVLLFLFPTTLLFYIVFCSLRLAVVFVIGFFDRGSVTINTIPSFAVLLHFGNSRLVAGDVRFAVVEPHKLEQSLTLKLEVVASPLKKVWNSAMPLNFVKKEQPSWGRFLKDLLIGNLVYPL